MSWCPRVSSAAESPLLSRPMVQNAVVHPYFIMPQSMQLCDHDHKPWITWAEHEENSRGNGCARKRARLLRLITWGHSQMTSGVRGGGDS